VVQRAFEIQKTHDLFEILIERIYKRILKPGDHAIDCGCNEGRHTLPLAQVVGPTGIVVGFEAIPLLARRLIEAKNLPQLRIYNKAVGEKEGNATFVLFPSRTGWSGLRPRPDAVDLERQTINVDVTIIDDLPFSQIANLGFIKMDIEGGEFHAMKGARRVLTLRKPVIVFENGGASAARVYKYTHEEWQEFLRSLGYRVYDILGRPYTTAFWNGALCPWNSIAVADGSVGARFAEQDLPDMVRATMDACTLEAP
jgi:FkbM family methyltransferase